MTAARAATDYREVIGEVDAAIVAVPTIAHAEIGCALLEAGIDVLIEKPIAPTLAEADRLVEAAARNGRILQVGHLERFNPAVIALEKAATLPLFFEIHRMSVFTPRSLDVDVVLDLMIHDLDIVLALARGKMKEIRAAGISILSPKVNIANVRLRIRRRMHCQSHRQPRLYRKGAQAPPFPAKTVHFGRLCQTSRRRFHGWRPDGNCVPAVAGLHRLSRCNCNLTPFSMRSKLAGRRNRWPYGA